MKIKSVFLQKLIDKREKIVYNVYKNNIRGVFFRIENRKEILARSISFFKSGSYSGLVYTFKGMKMYS